MGEGRLGKVLKKEENFQERGKDRTGRPDHQAGDGICPQCDEKPDSGGDKVSNHLHQNLCYVYLCLLFSNGAICSYVGGIRRLNLSFSYKHGGSVADTTPE